MKNLNNLILLTQLFILACTTQNSPYPIEKAPKPSNIIDTNTISQSIRNCICPQLWMPVCGENGKTYSNACFANCNEVKFSQGSCEKSLDK
jgi:hypothetical protein